MGIRLLLVVVPWLGLWVATLPPPVALAPPLTCTKEECLANPGTKPACCRLELGCPCKDYAECGDFDNGILPLGESFITDFATKTCTCKANQKLECISKTCEPIPKNCKDIEERMDSCRICRDPAPA